MIALPDSSRHSTTLRPRRRSEIGFSPRKCDGQIGYQMLRTPLASSALIDWLVTAVIVASLPSRAQPLHLALEQVRAPGLTVRRGHRGLVEARHEPVEIVNAGGVGALDRIAQQVLVVVR